MAKVFGAIFRFSEDVDLGISPASRGWPEERLEHATRNAWNERIRPELEAACAQHVSSHWLPDLESDFLTQLGARPGGGAWRNYKLDAVSHSPILFFAYPGALPRSIDYIAREVKMEFGSLADQRPAGRHQITAMVAELAPTAFADFGAEVMALEIERTF